MKQETINETVNIKEEIDLDWDEKDNCHGNVFDDIKAKSPEAVISKKRPRTRTTKKKPGLEGTRSTKKFPNCKKVVNIPTYRGHKKYCGKKRHFQCAHCDYNTHDRKCLISHLCRNHPEGNDTISIKAINEHTISKYCQKCDKVTENMQIINCYICFSKLLYKCSKCEKIFDNYKQASYHSQSKCGVKGYYHCHLCEYKAVFRSHVVDHSKKVHKNSLSTEMIQWKRIFNGGGTQASSLHKCPKCAKITSNAITLQRHIILCKGVGNIDKLTITSSAFDYEPNRCSTCGKRFEFIQSLNRHYRACKRNQDIVERTNDSDDDYIEVVGVQSEILPEKISYDVRQMVVTYCDKCQVESDIKEKWDKIYCSKKLKCPKCKSNLEYKCKKCLKEFDTKSRIFQHLQRTCYPTNMYKCTKCNFKSKRAEGVRSHHKSIHSTGSSVCERCGKSFQNPRSWEAHVQRCGVEPKFQCDHCPYKTKTKNDVKVHILRMHMKVAVVDTGTMVKISKQRFSRLVKQLEGHCSKCKRKQLLNNRLKICKNCKTKLNFKCKVCRKNYAADNENGCDHLNAFLEMIKFECKRCGRGLRSKRCLSTHTSYCGRQIPCRFCKFVSDSKVATRRHEKAKHSDEV